MWSAAELGAGQDADAFADGGGFERGRAAAGGQRRALSWLSAAGDGDVALAPGVLGAAAAPVVEVDPAASDRCAGVGGQERAVPAERVRPDLDERAVADQRGVDGEHVPARPPTVDRAARRWCCARRLGCRPMAARSWWPGSGPAVDAPAGVRAGGAHAGHGARGDAGAGERRRARRAR